MEKNTTPHPSLISEYAFIAYFFIFSFFPFSADILKLLCLLTMIGCWAARMLSEKKVLFTKTALNIPLFLFLLCAFMASFHSAHIRYSLEMIFHDYLIYGILFFCMVNTMQSQEQIQRIVKAMLITYGLVCAYGLYGYYTGIAIRDARLVATFEYHSRIAKYISLFLPFALCFFFYYKSLLTRFSLACLIFVGIFSLLLTMSRTSWVAVFVTVFFIGFAARKKYLIFALIGMGALLICILPSKFITHVKTITQVNKFFVSEEILGERLLCWKASIAIIKDHPVLGIGPGKRNFRAVYQHYANKIQDTERQMKKEPVAEQPQQRKTEKKNRAEFTERMSHPHNLFLQIWVDTGIVGLLSFLWLFSTVFYVAIKSWRISKERYEKTLLMSIVASLIAIFSHAWTETFWKKPEAIFLWYIMGILFTTIHLTPNREQSLHR